MYTYHYGWDGQVYRKRKQNVAMDTDQACPIKIRHDAMPERWILEILSSIKNMWNL